MRSSSTWVRCSARVIAASFASSAFVTLSQRSANSVRARCAFSATAVTWATSACSLEPALDVVLRDQRLAHRAFGRFQLLGLLAQLVPGRVEKLLGDAEARGQPLHLHLEVGDVVARRRALALAQRLEAVAQRLLGLELGLELAEVLARRRKLALALVMSGADHGEAVRLLAGCGPQGPGLVLEHLDRLAGVGELTLVARDNEIVRLRLLAQRRVLLDESMGTLGLAPDLALELGGVRLLLAEVAADRGERRLLLLRALAQLLVVRAQAAELVLELEVLALEAADLLRQRAVPLALAGKHRLGFEKLRLELRKLGRESRDRLEQLGEIVLEARDVVEALRHMADAGTDELVLHADGTEREARVGVPSPVVVMAVAVQVLRPAGHVRIPLIPRLKMSFQEAP